MGELHVIEVRADGFTLQHPLVCRPRLFECSYNRAAERLDAPPCAPGLYVCRLDADGQLVIVRSATGADLQADVLGELLAEWQRDQLAGVPTYPNGTGEPGSDQNFTRLNAHFHNMAAVNMATWVDVLNLSVAAAAAESDLAKLRLELLGVGVQVIAWINDIDRQSATAAAGEQPSAQVG